jgi:prepilin-type N-terminal cleavage/methylation domain-containing protein
MKSGSAVKKCEHGFSLIELLIVVAISMIAAAMALPLVSNAVNQVHLSSSATDYANLLQIARMRAVQDDTYYQIRTTTLAGDPIAYVDINKNASYDNGEPMMVFASGVTSQLQSKGPGLSNLKSQFLPSGSVAQNSLQPTTIPIFGPRGLPCQVSGSACPYLDAKGNPTSYLLFIQNTQNGGWEAVTINPSARIREWSYAAASSTWSPLN